MLPSESIRHWNYIPSTAQRLCSYTQQLIQNLNYHFEINLGRKTDLEKEGLTLKPFVL